MKLSVLYHTKYLPVARRKLKPRTIEEYDRIMRAVVLPHKIDGRQLADWNLEALTLEATEELHADLSGGAPVYANRAVSALSAVLSYAVTRRLLPYNPCRGVARNPEAGKEFFYSPEQTDAIIRVASSWPDIRGKYIALTLLTGCRPNELRKSGPAWRHGAALKLPDSKTGTRTVFLSPAAEAILDSLEPFSADGALRYFPDAMDLRRAWSAIVAAAGVPRARLYDLRHTFASAALAAGVPLDIVGRMLGHVKADTTLRYAHLAPDVGVAAAAKAAKRMRA